MGIERRVEKAILDMQDVSFGGFAGQQGWMLPGSTTKAGGTLPVPITAAIVLMTTGGAEALTLADGRPGQVIVLTLATDGGDGTLTPATSTGWSTCVFADAGDSCSLMFIGDTTGWVVLSAWGVSNPPAFT